MIQAVFTRKGGGLSAVTVSGHAGYAPAGADIVCAAVTSAVQMAANGITEVLGLSMPIHVGEDKIAFSIPDDSGAQAFLEALYLHLEVLSQDYKKHIKLSVLEV